jgi:hypothetical protein
MGQDPGFVIDAAVLLHTAVLLHEDLVVRLRQQFDAIGPPQLSPVGRVSILSDCSRQKAHPQPTIMPNVEYTTRYVNARPSI